MLGRQDVAQWGRASEICSAHCKSLEMFCEDHQDVCCSVCVAVNHRQCSSVRHIPEISKGFQEKPEYKRLPDMIADIISKLDCVKRYEQEHRKEVQDAGTKIRDEIRSLRVEINKLLDDIEKTTLNQLEDYEADIVTEVNDNIQKIIPAHESVANFNEMLLSEKSEKSSFILYYQCQREKNVAECLLQEISSKPDKLFSFQSDINDFRKLISERKMFGTFENRRCLGVKLCGLPKGELLIVDVSIQKLKLLDTKYQLVAHENLGPARPYNVCHIADYEVAVVIVNANNDKSEVHLYTVTSRAIRKTRRFPVQHRVIAISHYQGKLYVVSSNNTKSTINLHTMNGDLVTKIYEEPCCLRSIAISNDGNFVYVVRWEAGDLITLDSNGNKISTFCDPQLKSPSGVHASESGHVFVCYYSSNTVLQLDRERKRKLAVVARKVDGVDSPVSLWFSLRTSSLIVGQDRRLLVLKLV
ncbi:uncharacterized protein LOC128240480 [Mya arenaria]|uniref:uncharacterized protein LOC128240480 n=1 Tax=Mya arenaria TaxID=6604 RepID=UPI0022E14EB0|nr:uncharacterized protein LOC128240480 [Mya arenaria]